MTAQTNPNWLGDPARFDAVIAGLGNRPTGCPPEVDESLAADWVGYCYGPTKLLDAAELLVRCVDCGGEIILAVSHVGGHPLLLTNERGDRIARAPGPRRWEFSWLNRGVVAHARCDHRFEIDLQALREITPQAGSSVAIHKVKHTTMGGIVR